ncbi:MAG: oxamate carbamoyltransferase subunit AllH family protein [Anaerolineae bacterium]
MMLALSLSSDLIGLVADTRLLRVHSVFRRVVNLQGTAGDWVTLACPEVGNLPRGIVVDAAPDLNFKLMLRPGQDVTIANGLLVAGTLLVDLSDASTWDPCLARDELTPWVRNWPERWATAWSALLAHAPPESLPMATRTKKVDLAPPIARLLGQAVDRLVSTCRALESERAGVAASALVGLGSGLTPAGDDLLVGLLAGLWLRYARSDGAERVFVQHLAWQVGKAADRTTDVSRVYLLSAARGCVSQKLKDLATSIVLPAPRGVEALPEVEWRVRDALSVGATSGADGVYGLLLGIQLWGEHVPEERRFVGREPVLTI